MCAGFAASRAPQTVQKRVPLVRASVTRCSAAWSMLRPATTYSPYRIRSTCQRVQATKQPSRNNKQRMKGQTNPQPKKERGEVQVAGVRVFLGRQSSASLVTSASSREAKPIRTKRKRRQRKKHREAPHKHKKKPNQQEGGEANKPNRTEGSEAGRTKQERKGAWGKKASGGQQKRKERTPRKTAGAEKTAQTKKADAFSVSGVLRGFLITQGRISQCRCERYLNNTTTWWRGQSLTQGRSLCSHEEE